jgi:PKHD-type hydroxylase
MAPTDYQGGVLEFSGRDSAKAPPAAGTGIVFPSFMAHRLSPVTQGRRVSVVAYAYGPTFE